jgi:hypothetical protein
MTDQTYVRCPECGAEIAIPRRTAFKRKCTAGGALGGVATGATAGAIYGTGVGIATGGTAIAGTVPLGIVGGAVGGLLLGIGGRIGANWAAARVACTAEGCGAQFRI